MMCKQGDRRKPDLKIVGSDTHLKKVRRELDDGTRYSKPMPTEWMDVRRKPVDCSAGDGARVILSQSTAILLAEAFCDMANERRLYVTGVEGAENFTRAFLELELLKKAIGDGVDG